MDTRPKSAAAGGFPIAVGAIGGAVLGSAAGQPTLGFCAGLAAGVAVAVLIWLRRR